MKLWVWCLGCGALGAGLRSRVQICGFGVEGWGLRVEGSGSILKRAQPYGVQALGCTVQGSNST